MRDKLKQLLWSLEGAHEHIDLDYFDCALTVGQVRDLIKVYCAADDVSLKSEALDAAQDGDAVDRATEDLNDALIVLDEIMVETRTR